MKKRPLLTGFTAVLILLVTAFLYLIQRPRPEHTALVNAALASSQERFQAQMLLAQSSEHNGYLDKLLQPLWTEKSPQTPEYRALRSWLVYCEHYEGKKIDHQQLLESHDPSYSRSRKSFEALLPHLLNALSKPCFVVPDVEPSEYSKYPDHILLRQLSMALFGYIESLAAEGRMDQAAPSASASLLLGRRLMDNGRLRSKEIGLACQAIGLDAVLKNFSPTDSSLNTESWSSLAQSLEESLPPRHLIRHILEDQLAFGINTIKEARRVGASPSRHPVWEQLPGMMERELKIFKNQMGEKLHVLEQGLPLSKAQSPELNYGNLLRGRSGYFAKLYVPAYGSTEQHFRFHRRRMLGALAACRAIVHLKKTGEFPQSPAELGLQGEPVTLRPDSNTIFVAVDSSDLQALHYPRDEEDRLQSDWYRVEGDGLIFPLKP